LNFLYIGIASALVLLSLMFFKNGDRPDLENKQNLQQTDHYSGEKEHYKLGKKRIIGALY